VNEPTSHPCCIWLEDAGALLVQREGLPQDLAPELRAALESCPECQAALVGAGHLRARLDQWPQPEPADDLIERSLAAIALKAAMSPAESEAPAGEVIPFPTPAAQAEPSKGEGPRRRTTVIELLVTPPLSGPVAPVAPTRGRLAFRFVLQAAAAVVLFGISSIFVATYYPAVSHALEERDQVECQKRLRHLRVAALRYRKEHPEGGALVGFELRRELIRGGYADESDFVCPSERGQELGVRSYLGEIPAASVAQTASGSQGERPVFWDRFGNHSSGFNLIRLDGRVSLVSEENLTRWRLQSSKD
jgi:hypothetical protein